MSNTLRFLSVLIVLGLLVLLPNCTRTEGEGQEESAGETMDVKEGSAGEEMEAREGCAAKATEAKVYFLYIKPASDDPADKTYRVVCKNDAPVHVQTVNVGEWIAWTHSLEADKTIKLKFTKDLALFGLEDRTIRVHKDQWTWMRVQKFAAFGPDNKHLYKVLGYSHDDPPPGIIVNPPPDDED